MTTPMHVRHWRARARLHLEMLLALGSICCWRGEIQMKWRRALLPASRDEISLTLKRSQSKLAGHRRERYWRSSAHAMGGGIALVNVPRQCRPDFIQRNGTDMTLRHLKFYTWHKG